LRLHCHPQALEIAIQESEKLWTQVADFLPKIPMTVQNLKELAEDRCFAHDLLSKEAPSPPKLSIAFNSYPAQSPADAMVVEPP